MSDTADQDGSTYANPVALPDPHGEAALLLVESLIHGLVAHTGLSTAEAIEIVQGAIDVQHDVGDGRGDDPLARSSSAGLLAAIANSLRIDTIESRGLHVVVDKLEDGAAT